MCRAGGRRCPSHLSDLARRARNAKRRAEYSTMKMESLDKSLDTIVASGDQAKLDKVLSQIEKHRLKKKGSESEANALQQQYVDSIAENALISDKQEAAAAHAGKESSSQHVSSGDIGGTTLKQAIAALPKVFGGRQYKEITGKKLFHDTDEITSANPDLGIYKTKNTGKLADLRYFNPETIRGKIVKSELNEESAHKDFGFKKIDRESEAYDIVSFNDVGENKEFGAEQEESKVSVAEVNMLTMLERSSINGYTDEDFQEINDTLYMQEGNYEEAVHVGLYDNINNIDRSLEKSPKRQRYLYRSMTKSSNAMNGYSSCEEWVDEKFQIGEDVSFDGYQSSSSEKAGIIEFANHDSVVFEILSPEGLNITSLSDHRRECETLLPRQARYKVVGIEKGVDVKFSEYDTYNNNTIVRMVAVNSEGEILDGSNSDKVVPVKGFDF